MLALPTTLCGVATLAALPHASPTVVAEAEVVLTNGSPATLRELQWQLDHFEVKGFDLATVSPGATLHTYTLAAAAFPEVHLEQNTSSFWASSACAVTALEKAGGSRVGSMPNWHSKSNRYWPHVAGSVVPFVGQAFIGGYDIYLFQGEDGTVCAHRVPRSEQDVEDHYAQEG